LPLIAVAGKYKLSVGYSVVGIEYVVLFGFDLFAWFGCLALLKTQREFPFWFVLILVNGVDMLGFHSVMRFG
jgi:hypothetical protein